MAIIIQHIISGEKAVLIGTGFGAFSALRPSMFWGNLDPQKESGTVGAVCVCDKRGNIRWVKSKSIRVVEIDGKPPQSFEISDDLSRTDSNPAV